MKKFRQFLMVTLAVVVSGALASCGGGGGGSQSTQVPPAPAPSPTQLAHPDAFRVSELIDRREVRRPLYTSDNFRKAESNGELIIRLTGNYGARLEIELATTVKTPNGQDAVWYSTNGYLEYHKADTANQIFWQAIHTPVNPIRVGGAEQVAGPANKRIDLGVFTSYGMYTEDYRQSTIRQNADGNWPAGSATIWDFDPARLDQAQIVHYPRG